MSPPIPWDGTVGFTKALPVPTHPVHLKGCCCRVYIGTTSHHTPQGMLLSGLHRHHLSPHTPRDAAVGFTKVLPLPTHLKGCCCRVYKGTTSHHTPQGMLLSGLQRYYLSPQTPYTPGMLLSGLQRYYLSLYIPYTPRDGAVGFTKVPPLPRYPHTPRDAAVGFIKVLPLPHTPPTPQRMLLLGLKR